MAESVKTVKLDGQEVEMGRMGFQPSRQHILFVRLVVEPAAVTANVPCSLSGRLIFGSPFPFPLSRLLYPRIPGDCNANVLAAFQSTPRAIQSSISVQLR